MPAINYEEDTEFNEALRRHGILPPKQPAAGDDGDADAANADALQARPDSPSLSDLDDLDDLDINVDDKVRRDELEQQLAQRKREQQQLDSKQKFGRVYPISKPDYKREVTDASTEQLPGEPEDWGTGVVCVLHKDRRQLMPIINELASLYPATKFVSIVSDQCIENYPDKNVPTVIVYRNGKMMGQVVGISAYGGEKMKLIGKSLHAQLDSNEKGIDFHLKKGYDQRSYESRQNEARDMASAVGGDLLQPQTKSTRTQEKKHDDEDENDDSEDDQTFVGGGRRSGIRSSSRKIDSDDDEFDL
ncbi:Proteolipid protein 2 [Microbotryomycetes sp. JL201]|nr:Proteolipid protein 2 [Microbotryomycetes sp. JL201]